MLALETALFILIAASYNGVSAKNQDCPSEWFLAEFVSLADVVLPQSAVFSPPDRELTFFRDIMLFTEEEIDQVTQDAMEFFNTRFGLDFSQAVPDELGQRTVGNATLAPFFLSPDIQYTITFNRWIINGKFRNRCFENRDGGFGVSFAAEQMLFGTYGGEEGRPISPGESVVYGFYNIPVCKQEPIVIQYNSGTPFRLDPVDGFGIINCELNHRVLGQGIAQGLFRVVPTDEPGMVRLTIRNLFTFPPNAGMIN